MKILSIETSCDETAISVIEIKGKKYPTFEVLADEINSQIEIHKEYGGVFPALAKREHIKNLPIILDAVLTKFAKGKNLKNKEEVLKKKEKIIESGKGIDLIAVTYGPGLEPALWTGIVFAKDLAKKWNKPLIPINHMEGHIFSVFGKEKEKFKIKKVKTPILSLLVSGGHTELVLVERLGKYKIIGQTLDDASGEAFDKVARMLSLPYPGGPEISRLAEIQRTKNQQISSLENSRNIVFKRLGRSDGNGQRKFSVENFRAFENNISEITKNNLKKDKQISSGFLSATAQNRKNTNLKSIAQGDGPSIVIGQQANIRGFQNSIFSKINLPRPMIHSKNFNFSFSGLKTAVLYLIRDLQKENPKILENEEIKRSIALEFENAVVETLVHKTKKAIEKYNIKTLIVGGGVSANKYLKEELKQLTNKKQELFFPAGKLATDNSIMIGIVAYFKYLENGNKKINLNKIKAEGNLKLK